MAGNNDDNRAWEDYAQPVIPNSPSCILLPTEARNYDLKSSYFHMLPSFYGLPNKDPLAHIKEFYNVVASLEKKLRSMLNMVPKIAEVGAICNIPGHPTYQSSASEGYLEFIQEQVNLMNSYNQRLRNDPFSNTYDPSWRDHPNLSWKNNNQFQNFQPKPATTLEDTVKMLAQNTVQFQQTTNSPTQEENEKLNDDPSNATSLSEAPNFDKAEKPYTSPIPFPGRLAKSKQDKLFKEIFDILSKVNVNLPLLDVIRNMPAKLLPKLKDPGSFSINITIGDKVVEKAVLDLGDSINLS
ncbi:hypothetical protein L3X38_011154 [Prunus dulcis]|uniref:Uncharacterized protein n=1 Tax=Prunus dulcis TaxID=3755 RepID=A0AAD4WGV6_PRUDU|nr:hypothetical protein L3X38_011154 [Prunus dulcis]